MEQLMDIKYIRIAELAENIEKVNQMIDLHEHITKNYSMQKQYIAQREEFLEELAILLKSLHLEVSLVKVA